MKKTKETKKHNKHKEQKQNIRKININRKRKREKKIPTYKISAGSEDSFRSFLVFRVKFS